jgi:type I restriction enzyme R subunit
MARRFKNSADPLKLVIVRDMWLTGFDVPCLHTMYVDKPMQGHGLMQAIARVNRVFKDKPGGLVVDYLGLADQLRKALANYTESGEKGEATLDQEEAVAIMLEKYEIARDMFHGFDHMAIVQGPPSRRMAGIAAAIEHVLSLKDGRQRFADAVALLSRAFALAVPHEAALGIRDEVGFFQTLRAALIKSRTDEPGRTQEELDAEAVRQIGMYHATEQCRGLLQENVAGIHFYTLNRSTATRAIYQLLQPKIRNV